MLKDSAADQLSPLSPAPFSLRQADRAEAREGASHISLLTSPGQIDRLLAAKLMVPSRRPRLVPRARLTQRLQAEPGRKLTLLVAPAGFGKTTLLLDWITSGRQRTAWLSLEADDNSPVRFWHYVVAALQTVRPELGTATLATLRECEPSQLEPAVAELLNELAAVEQDLVLILDDCQVITEPAIHAALTFLLEHLPPHLQLVLASRVEPPLPLARLRARGQIVEVQAEDLRLSAEEATRFLADTMELVLDTEQVAQLVARTEGWVAGLQLAALALWGHADVDQVLVGFSGTHRYLVDYLAKDVLLREPDPVQRFLLETSLLERLCAPLCAAVTGSAEAEQLLEQAEQANLFLVPLDGHREWYRYHALFAQFLQEQLRHTSPDEVPTLHRRAAQWFEEQELIAEAMHHALAGADYECAARLLTQHARAFLRLGETRLLRTWLQALPEAVVRAEPRLCLLLADALTAMGHIAAADGWLQAAEERLRAGEPVGAQAENGALGLLEEVRARRAALAARQLDLPSAQERVRQTGGHLPPDDALGRSLVAYDLGIASFCSGDMVAASQAFAEASLLGAAAGSLYYELAGLQGVGGVLMVRGKLRQAAETFRQVLQRLADQQGQPALLAGAAHTSLGMVLREWNDLDGAEQALLADLEQVTRGGHFSMQVLASLQLARLRQARSDAVDAQELLARAQEAVGRSDEERFAGMVAACQVQLWLQQGRLTAADHWASTMRHEPEQPITCMGEMERLALVRVQLALVQVQDALLTLDRLRLAAEAAGRVGSVLEILLLEALAQQRLGNTAQALAQLAEALALSEPGGYVRLFVDEGPVMEGLLALAAQRRHCLAVPHSSVAYLEHLLAAFGSSPAPRAPSSEPTPHTTQTQHLLEPLTARELAVLRLLASGQSTREIARELIVAPSTINWYLKHLYAKLQVHSRTQAISRARQFHLLE